ncbi:hypothetical protein F441_00608 [Phytophthora nicotianae CJ01A1]|uniref:Arrestin C-terminal-like domain-containing protein n=5 Tax=Phytophthora nicotianae TaxID=4792 RepID=W2RHJ7_PHYN3|nr:hypothetical protein PPTG_00511 [Phytophthora nicotianae INRA-310]ETI57006.1 hypothetical protein F443_00623 [Phytophthora nicotianae P1569]ETK96782.1 hypothetical protein L915_00575 [Phytophthora nicotianae]ETP26803.1 hypothetical protein F441_00608 [Phytophthora nicotianae CJ01A1]KUF81110.1 Arrestin domain-containing protein A [Phytophthora nicotianae]ETN24050.1 hypothetical protein PPTG_00511 [Phytophthora nicotianae INRA-310]
MGKLGKLFGFGDKGKIGITVDKPSYVAGDLVVGTIHVSIHDTIECDALVLKVSGKEKVELTHVRHETRDGETTVHRDQVHLGNEFFKQKIVICATSGRNYTPGRYSYPFEYQLPAQLPGVFHIAGYSQGDIVNLSAKIKYKFKATLDVNGFFSSDLKADCNLVVHERNFKELVPSEDSTTQDVKFLCCFNRGTCQLAVAMDKSVYFPGETAQIQCNITNGSTVEITAMRCKLYQDITVKITKEGSYRTLTKLMCESAFPGVPPGASLSQPQPLTLISTSSGHLQPSTKSDLIACAYRIDVECDIPWCPDVRLHLPINILAPGLPNPSTGWVLEPAEGV